MHHAVRLGNGVGGLTTVEGYAVCAAHAHLVDAHDFLRRMVESRQAVDVTLREVHDDRYRCACGKPAFWLLSAVKIAPGRYVEATV